MAFDIILGHDDVKWLADEISEYFDNSKEFKITSIVIEAGAVIDTKKLEICFKQATVEIGIDILTSGQLAVRAPLIVGKFYLLRAMTIEEVNTKRDELRQCDYPSQAYQEAFDQYAEERIRERLDSKFLQRE